MTVAGCDPACFMGLDERFRKTGAARGKLFARVFA
jgi:hypothetical protein